jgi:hypothetical protein
MVAAITAGFGTFSHNEEVTDVTARSGKWLFKHSSKTRNFWKEKKLKIVLTCMRTIYRTYGRNNRSVAKIVQKYSGVK